MKNQTNGTPYTNEQWAQWAAYKSNKDRWIEQEEARLDDIQEDSTSMEEKLEALDYDAKENEVTGN